MSQKQIKFRVDNEPVCKSTRPLSILDIKHFFLDFWNESSGMVSYTTLSHQILSCILLTLLSIFSWKSQLHFEGPVLLQFNETLWNWNICSFRHRKAFISALLLGTLFNLWSRITQAPVSLFRTIDTLKPSVHVVIVYCIRRVRYIQ